MTDEAMSPLRDQNRHVMTTIATSQYRDARRPCRSSTGHRVARAGTRRRPQPNRLCSINASLFDRGDLLNHRSGVDQCARLTRPDSATASAALKSQ